MRSCFKVGATSSSTRVSGFCLFDTCDFAGLLTNDGGGTQLKNCAHLGGASPCVTGAVAVTLLGTFASPGGYPIFVTPPTRPAGSGPLMEYVDGSGGSWTAPPPADYNAAIDRLAIAVAGLLGGTIP